MNYTVHIFGFIMFAGIVSSSPIGQMSITQKTVVSLLFFEWRNSEDVNLTTILKTSTLKDENNYQDCMCTPFHKCDTYKLPPDGKAIIDIRSNISRLVVRAGEWDLKTEKEILNHQDRRVTKVTYPYPYSGGFYNNVALIFTEHSFALQDNIQLMCLPSKNDIIINETCYSSGWGTTIAYNNYTIVKETETEKINETGQYKVSILKKYELPMVPRDKCSLALLGPKDLLQDSYICAGGMNGQDMCRNDNGSPFMCPYKDEPDRSVQVGIVVHCGKRGIPGAYMNVASFMEWINNEIEKYRGY